MILMVESDVYLLICLCCCLVSFRFEFLFVTISLFAIVLFTHWKGTFDVWSGVILPRKNVSSFCSIGHFVGFPSLLTVK